MATARKFARRSMPLRNKTAVIPTATLDLKTWKVSYSKGVWWVLDKKYKNAKVWIAR
jgi:hypothetical protein